MDDQPVRHPTDQTLHAYGLGKLDDASAESVNMHLEGCPACSRRVAELSADSFLGRLRDVQGRSEPPPPVVSSTTGRPGQPGERQSPSPSATGTLPPGLADHPDYEILRELGRGGMGVVYLAQNKLMGRYEVLKVVSGHLVKRSGVLDRFLGEIRNAAKLHHPNIVTAFSALRFGEDLVLSMEYVEGFDLSRVVKAKGPLPVATACSYVHQAALGLQHAHEQGMVHRDIKPSNLMLARLGNRAVVKILDFGLAKVQREQSPAGTLTQAGQLLGTPAYMAPEQTSDPRRVDTRADVYSLGCTLYYLLTRNPPFQGANLYDMLQAHQSMEAMPLNLARPDIPVQLAIVVATMMAKDPERRFQTPAEVAQALAPFLKRESPASQGSMPEISRPDAASRPELSRATGWVAGQPAVSRQEASPPSRQKSTIPTESDSGWDTLIEIKQEADLSEEVRAMHEAQRSRTWLWPAAAGVLVLLGLAVALGMRLGARNNQGSDVQPAPQVASLAKTAQPAPERRPVELARSPAQEEKPSPSVEERQRSRRGGPVTDETPVAKNKASASLGGIDGHPPEEMNPSKEMIVAKEKPDPDRSTRDQKTTQEVKASPAPDGPEALLESRGLVKKVESKRIYYIVPAEREFWEVMNKVRPAINWLDPATEALQTAVAVRQHLHQVDLIVTQLQFDIGEINATIGTLRNDPPGRAARAELQAVLQQKQFALAEAQREFVLTRKNAVNDVRLQALNVEYTQRKAVFMTAADEMNAVWQKLIEQYRALDTEEVRNAIKTLAGRFKAPVDLGPSGDARRARALVVQKQRDHTDDPDAFRNRGKKTRLKEKSEPVMKKK
jgi:serine/threonine protein kinase